MVEPNNETNETNTTEPVDLLGIIDTSQSQRILVLDPGEPPPKDKEVCAITLCEIDFEDEESLQGCIESLRQSAEELKKRPDEKRLWLWNLTYREGMTISFSINWYDKDFFEKRKGAFKNQNHQSYLTRFGASPDKIKVVHRVSDQ